MLSGSCFKGRVIVKMKIFKVFIILVVLCVFIPYAILPLIPLGELKKNGTHVVYITSNEIHTGFMFPKNEVMELVSLLPDEMRSSNFAAVDFSFGDIDFFEKAPTWDKFTFSIFFDALFIPDAGLMHVDLYEKIPVDDPSFKKIHLNDDQFNSLVSFIRESFVLKDKKAIQYKELSYYGTDRFFQSNQSYHFFHTCNSWTGRGLRKIGIRTGFTTPHKWAVIYHLD